MHKAKLNDIQECDTVLIRQKKTKKLSTPFKIKPYKAAKKKTDQLFIYKGDAKMLVTVDY